MHTDNPHAPGGATCWCEECQQWCGGPIHCNCCAQRAAAKFKPSKSVLRRLEAVGEDLLELPETLGEKAHEAILGEKAPPHDKKP